MADEVKNIGIGYSEWDASTPRTKVGIGLFGRGFMGKAHTNAYKKIDYLFESNYSPGLAAISASTIENAKSAADRYGYKKFYTGWEDMIADPTVQVFDNVSVDKLHEEPCIAAAAAGKAIICEKPLTSGRESAKRMLDAVNKAGVKNAVCFNYRFIAAVRLAYELIQKGAIGEVVHFYGRYHQQYGLPLDAPMEDVWYQNMTGNAQGLASHLIDQSRFLVGEIATIMGDIRSYPDKRPSTLAGGILKEVKFDDGMRAIIDFKNGATGTIENLSVASGRHNQLYWEIYGTKGTLIFDLENPTYLKVQTRDSIYPEVNGFTDVSVTQPGHPFTDIWWPAGHNTGWEHGHINLIAHFLDCVVNDKDFAPYGATFEDGYKVAVILETLAESSRLGKRVEIEY